MFEVTEQDGYFKLTRTDKPKYNQNTQILHLMLNGEVMDRMKCLRVVGSVKLPSRISEIKQALLSRGLVVSHYKIKQPNGSITKSYYLDKATIKALRGKKRGLFGYLLNSLRGAK